MGASTNNGRPNVLTNTSSLQPLKWLFTRHGKESAKAWSQALMSGTTWDRSSVSKTPSGSAQRSWYDEGRGRMSEVTPTLASSVIVAPSGYTDSEDDSDHVRRPSYSIQAPSGYSDSESESDVEEGEVQSRLAQESPLPFGTLSTSLSNKTVTAITALLHQRLLVKTQRAVGQFEAALLEIDAEELVDVEAGKKERLEKQAAEEEEEEGAREAVLEESFKVLTGLRSEHRAKAERVTAQVEAAKREEAAREEERRVQASAAAEARRQAEAERLRKAEADEKARAEAEIRAREAAQQAVVPSPTPVSVSLSTARRTAQPASASGASSTVRSSPAALEKAKELAGLWAAAQEETKHLREDPLQKKERRGIEKVVTLNVQQISASKQQVNAKATALFKYLQGLGGANQTYGYLALASRLASQCECQVSLNPSFAFPLAEVAVTIMNMHPRFAALLLAKLQQVCILIVPKYCSGRAGASVHDYFESMGYKNKAAEGADAGSLKQEPVWESTDDYVGRLKGYLLFYAAILQSDRNHDGPGVAWTYLAQVLNHLPVNRITATALDSFLTVAGYKLSLTFRGQFFKLAQYIVENTLPDLERDNDHDARAVHARLETYLCSRAFNVEPEGRTLPESDLSSLERA